MGVEIERKFLVDVEQLQAYTRAHPTMSSSIVQGYIKREGTSQVRIRVRDQKACITLKGSGDSLARPEWEYDIPVQDALEMLDVLCKPPHIQKVRHYIKYKGHLWEVDEFLGDNLGLWVAEVELQAEDEDVVLPPFVTEEITSQELYGNVNLSLNPYCSWPNSDKHYG